MFYQGVAMKRKILWISAGLGVLFLALCGGGGIALFRSLNSASRSLEAEYAAALANGMPTTAEEIPRQVSVEPADNAALGYKAVFDEWQRIRPSIDDDRWQSFSTGRILATDKAEVMRECGRLADLFKTAAAMPKAQWAIDYRSGAFTQFPVWAAIGDAALVWTEREQKFGPEEAQVVFAASNQVLGSNDPGSLRTASIIRIEVLKRIASQLPASDANTIRAFREILDKTEPIDPFPVWQATAFLHYDTWTRYDELTEAQREVFGGSMRDQAVVVDAQTAEILKFWNSVFKESKGQMPLTQYTFLGEAVRKLRERTDPGAMAIQKLWGLPSSKEGAGSAEWLVANEQLALIQQALDILAPGGPLPESFACKRVSVLGLVPFTYERITDGFKLSAKPASVLAPDSPLAQQNLAYEYRSK